jgi:F-box/leucine-rich repeat protein 2/20
MSLRSLSCFELLSFHISDELLSSIAGGIVGIVFLSLPLRRLVLRNCTGYSYSGIYCLLYNCRSIQHLDLQNATFLNDQRVAQLSSFLGDLTSVNLSKCSMLTHLALFELIKSCPSLSEIKMEYTCIGKNRVEISNSLTDFVVNPQLKSLYLAHNRWLRNESLIMFASISPNLQLLDLSYCYNISEESIYQVLKRCCKIRHLNLTSCNAVKLYGMNFDVPKLEVLNLSDTCIGDETLYVISKNCCGLLQLSLECCYDVTEKGVKHVLENCTQLKEINLGCCYKVHASIVSKMIFLRPSLRKITAPPRYHVSDRQRELFSGHGCLVC